MKPVINAFLTTMLVWSGLAYSDAIEQARLIHNRLTGVPPSAAVMTQMVTLISQGQRLEAAKVALEQAPFYNVKLKNILNKWTNKDFSPDVPLNDMTATMIGMIRDDLPFNTILSDDIIYAADPALVPVATAPVLDFKTNAHYLALDQREVDLQRTLVRRKQSDVSDIPDAAIAGVLTLRAFAESYYSAGTNRRANEAVMNNFLCHTMAQLADTTIPDFMVRRDVDRSPAGDSKTFKNKCVGCHAGQDAMAGWTAHYDYDMDTASLVHSTEVQAKMNNNATVFPDGRRVVDDSWSNLWTVGQNASLGWTGTQSGSGAKSFGEMITRTEEFSRCMSQKVFTEVCLRVPTSADDLLAVSQNAAKFSAAGKYSMKDLFAETAVLCLAPAQ